MYVHQIDVKFNVDLEYWTRELDNDPDRFFANQNLRKLLRLPYEFYWYSETEQVDPVRLREALAAIWQDALDAQTRKQSEVSELSLSGLETLAANIGKLQLELTGEAEPPYTYKDVLNFIQFERQAAHQRWIALTELHDRYQDKARVLRALSERDVMGEELRAALGNPTVSYIRPDYLKIVEQFDTVEAAQLAAKSLSAYLSARLGSLIYVQSNAKDKGGFIFPNTHKYPEATV